MKTHDKAYFALMFIALMLIVSSLCLTSCKPVDNFTVTTQTTVKYHFTAEDGTIYKGRQKLTTIENRLKTVTDSTETTTNTGVVGF